MSDFSKTYRRFIADELTNINQQFKDKGFNVHSSEDVNTYKGWINQGRKVKYGEKGLKVESNNKYSQPLFNCGAPIIDEKDKTQFAQFKKTYCLFHWDQTETVIA